MNSEFAHSRWKRTLFLGTSFVVFSFFSPVIPTGVAQQPDPQRIAPPQNPQLQQPGRPVANRFGGAGGPQTNVSGGPPVSLQFPLNPVNDILSIYERLIKKPIVKDSSIFEGPQISLVTPQEVSEQEAIRLIEATLLVNGYVLMPEEGGNRVKVLLGGARPGGDSPSFSEGIVIYTDANQLPSGEALVGFFMELDYINPEDAATIFANHISLNQFGKITPVSNPRGLLITETSPIVRQLIRLRMIIDHPIQDAPLITEFVKLQHAEANVVAQIIQAAMDARMEERQRQSDNQTLSGQSQQQQRQPQQQSRSNNSQTQRGATVNGIGSADQPAAQLIPDDRLNRIMVVASPTDAAYILQLIYEFDQPSEHDQPIERPLRYVKANDILPVIVDVLQDTGTGQVNLPGGRQILTRPTPVTSSQLATLTGANNAANNNQNRTNAGDSEVGGRADQIAFPIDEVAPISVLIGKTRIVADRQANSIIIIGASSEQQIVLDMIDRLDRRPSQVYLATVIGELSLTDDIEFGVDYIQQFVPFNNNRPGQGGFSGGLINGRNDIIGTNPAIADLRNMNITTPFGPASGLNLYGQLGADLNVVVTALEQTNRFKVLSRPVVYTQNGKRAEITSGQEVPVPVESLSDASGQVNTAAVRTSIDFKEVVLKLEVLPTINENDEVTLDIVQINDRVVGQQVVADSSVPIIGKQELNTTVTIADRSTIVLGGLISESKTVDDAGFPVLKNIPILGNAAKNQTKTKVRTELMIFIQPIVVHGDQDAVDSSYDEDIRSDIGQEAAQVFPEPGAPTLQHREEMTREVVDPPTGLQKLGRKLFGPKKYPHRALPIE